MLRLFLSAVFTIILLSADFAYAQSGQIEPNAGTWKTWVIASGKDFRVPPPPDIAATTGELAQLRDLLAKRTTRRSRPRSGFGMPAPPDIDGSA